MDRYAVVPAGYDESGQPSAWKIYDTVKCEDHSAVWWKSKETADGVCVTANLYGFEPASRRIRVRNR